MNYDVMFVKPDGTKDYFWCVNADAVGNLSGEAKANGWECYVMSAC